MNRVLLVCDADNKASAATIERNRGLFESIQVTEHGPARRYWIDTP
jgi:predicted acetyltransferase